MAPYLVIWMLFSFMYVFLPNTQVEFKSGVLAGVIAGTVYQIFQLIYVELQVGVTTYNAIYGSFAALPLFLIWLQLSWVILLFGAEISFFAQNCGLYDKDNSGSEISFSSKSILALLISHLVIKAFTQGGQRLTVSKISDLLSTPLPLVKAIVEDLERADILLQIYIDSEGELPLQPACSPDRVTIAYVINKLASTGNDSVNMTNILEYQVFSNALQKFREKIGESAENRLLTEI